MKNAAAKPMSERTYKKISIDRIKVINSRNRDNVSFQDNIHSIKEVGLLKPIVVNERYCKKTHTYELVCGEGRLLAFKALKRAKIPAEIINCTKKEALLYSLVENIARVPPSTMWFAYEIKRMRDAGITLSQISNIVGKSEPYVRDYIGLVEQGEARLIKGAEDGLFPMSFAVQVARSDDSIIQNILMDAFDSGIVNSKNFSTVKNIIDLRINRGKRPIKKQGASHSRSRSYTFRQLKYDIKKITKEKEAFVNEASVKENRLLSLFDRLNTLWKDKELVNILTSEGMGPIPNLKGDYNV
ncbi:ParB/RepB/Spo0J family partition protein [Planctomycetota bacterium]